MFSQRIVRLMAVVGVAAGSLVVGAAPADAATVFEPDWAIALGGGSADEARGAAVDSAGKTYVVGAYEGTADLDPGPGVLNLAASGGQDVFVWKGDADGKLVWAHGIGGVNDDWGHGVAVDVAGNVYVVGSFVGTVDFDPGPGTFNLTSFDQTRDAFVLKLDTAGIFVWARQVASSFSSSAADIALDGLGNAYVGGAHSGVTDFDPGSGTSLLETPIPFGDAFVWKLDPDGAFLWVKSVTGTDVSFVRSIAWDPAGSIVAAGDFLGNNNFDPGGTDDILPGDPYGNDGFVWKLSANGSYEWAAHIAGEGGPTTSGVAVAPDSSILVTGDFTSATDFDPGSGTVSRTASGNVDAYVLKLNVSGSFVWVRTLGATGQDRCLDVAVDTSGNVYATGYFTGIVDFDPGSGLEQRSANTTAGYVWSLTPAGTYRSAFVFGDSVSQPDPQAIVVDANRNVIIAGLFSGAMDLDPGPGKMVIAPTGWPGAASEEAFVARFTQNSAPGDFVDADDEPNLIDEDSLPGIPANVRVFSIDPDGHDVRYSLRDDADGRFAIDPATGVVTVADASLLDGPAEHTIVAVASDYALSTSAPFTIEVANVAPMVDVSTDSVAMQYSDPVPEVTITASDIAHDSLDVRSAWDDAGSIPAGVTLTGTGGPGSGDWVLDGIADLAPGTHHTTITVIDEDGGETVVRIRMDVAREDATVSFAASNPHLVLVDADGDSGPFTVGVTLADSLDGNPGNIAYATLDVTLVPIGPGDPVPGSCKLGGGGDWTCNFDDVPVNGYTVQATVGGFYAGSGESLLVVGDPKGGSAKGYGRYTNEDDEKTSFGFTARYKKRSEQLKGRLVVVNRGDDGRSWLKINKLTGLAVGSDGGSDWAVLIGTGTYRPAHGRCTRGCQAIVYVEDGSPDRLWIDASCNGKPIPGMSMSPDAPDNALQINRGAIKVRR